LKKALIISFNYEEMARDPRVLRQIECCKNHFALTAIGIEDPKLSFLRFIRLLPPERTLLKKIVWKFRAYEQQLWWKYGFQKAYDILRSEEFDLIIANEIESLPLSFALRKKAKIIFDAHEYYPKEFEESFLWRFFCREYYEHLCRTYIPLVDSMTTICKSIADSYQINYKKSCEIIMNTAKFHELKPSAIDISNIKLIHHGAAIKSRHIETMIYMQDYLDDKYHLYLMLVGPKKSYYNYLQHIASKRRNVHFLDPVGIEQIIPTLNQFDVGLYLLPDHNFNHKHALPNKFFEFVQARIAIAIGPSLEMAALVREYDLGIIAKDFSPQAMANEIKTLNQKRIEYYKKQSNLAAQSLNDTQNIKKLHSLIKLILENK